MVPILQLVSQIETSPLVFNYRGNEVTVRNLSSLYEKERIQGYVEKAGSNSYKIMLDISVINTWPRENDVKRFIIAHELGHIMLGHADRKVDTWHAEAEADCYALKILAESGYSGKDFATTYYDLLVDRPASGRPGRIAHMDFIDSCDI